MTSLNTAMVLLFACLALAGCVTEKNKLPPVPTIGGDDQSVDQAAPPDFQGFAGKVRSGDGAGALDAERYSALKEAALAYSAQAGYARRSWEISRALEAESAKLSSEFNFNQVVYKAPKEAGYVVPPVVSHATRAITIARHGRESVAADEYYRIEKPGHLVGIIPTWRDYLIMTADKAPDPADAFLPSDPGERKIWTRYMAEGWKKGEEQADAALKANMNLVRRDYLGMVEYRRLVKAGLIRDMVIRASEVRAEGTPDELFIGQRRVRIVSSARFNRNPADWKPVTRRFDVYK